MTREDQLRATIQAALRDINNDKFSMQKRLRLARQTLSYAVGDMEAVSYARIAAEQEEDRSKIAALEHEQRRLRNQLAVIAASAKAALEKGTP